VRTSSSSSSAVLCYGTDFAAGGGNIPPTAALPSTDRASLTEVGEVAEQFESATSGANSNASCFSHDACVSLASTVETYLKTGGVPDQLAAVTGRLCRDAQARGLSADATLREIRAALGNILARCPITSTDRAALVALAIDECVHAFYAEQG
jgi:hypothetical protein